MTKKLKVNWVLLKKCRDLFKAKPSKSYMIDFVCLKYRYNGIFDVGDEVPICKTHLCIGGSALLLSGGYKIKVASGGLRMSTRDGRELNYIDVWKAARRVLGLSETQAIEMFNESAWPAKFQSEANTTGSRTLARNMIARINHFIKTKGRE